MDNKNRPLYVPADATDKNLSMRIFFLNQKILVGALSPFPVPGAPSLPGFIKFLNFQLCIGRFLIQLHRNITLRAGGH